MNVSADAWFRLLSDSTRLRALLLLVAEGELCVCELTHALAVPQPKISRHLALLREAGMVLDRREGLWVHYRIHPELPDWARQVLATTCRGLQEQRPFRDDRRRLAGMGSRPPRSRCA